MDLEHSACTLSVHVCIYRQVDENNRTHLGLITMTRRFRLMFKYLGPKKEIDLSYCK